MTTAALRTLPLAGQHRALGARFAPFAGWQMPVPYTGIIEEHRAAAEAKNLTLEVQSCDSLPETIRTEERHLHVLLATLIDNAVRYTDAGSVSLTLSLENTESWQHPPVGFKVEDSGNGIPHAQRGSIFEPSARNETDCDRQGYGFGLALAKRLAVVLGGDLRVRSEVGSGSVFSLSLEVTDSVSRQAA